MGLVTLDKEEIEEGIGVLIKVANQDLLDDIKNLADALSKEADNVQLEQLYKNCVTFQAGFNDGFKESMDKLINDFSQVFDIAAVREKSSISEVKPMNAAFQTTGIDASGIVM